MITSIVIGLILLINKFIHYNAFKAVSMSSENKNVKAFLAVLRWSENKANVSDESRYRTLYGGTLFSDYSDHPFLTGEWKGAKLPDSYCRGAGLSPGCITTAAGAYQFISSTWKRMRDKLDLKDFSPASQDLAAIQLIKDRKALTFVENGRFEEAVSLLRVEWASLPGSGVGQPTNSLASLASIYLRNGGTLA